MKRFYFTNDATENVAEDYCGNLRGARTFAQKIANERNETIIINDCRTDEIEDFVDPDSYDDEQVIYDDYEDGQSRAYRQRPPGHNAP